MEEKILEYFDKHPMNVILRLIITLIVVVALFIFISNAISSFIIKGIVFLSVIIISCFAFLMSFLIVK